MPGGSSDLQLVREARKVFVRHWVDLGRLHIRCTNAALSVRGSLQKMPGTGEQLTDSSVGTIFQELKRIRGIKRINATLDDWQELSPGVWKGSGNGGSSSGPETSTGGEGATITFKDP